MLIKIAAQPRQLAAHDVHELPLELQQQPQLPPEEPHPWNIVPARHGARLTRVRWAGLVGLVKRFASAAGNRLTGQDTAEELAFGGGDGSVYFGLAGGELGRVLLLDALGDVLIVAHQRLQVAGGGVEHAEVGVGPLDLPAP